MLNRIKSAATGAAEWGTRYARKIAAGAVIGTAALATSPAAATPPSMSAIDFPIDTASIVTAVVTAGATLLLAYFGVKVGFSFVKKLLGRLHRSV